MVTSNQSKHFHIVALWGIFQVLPCKTSQHNKQCNIGLNSHDHTTNEATLPSGRSSFKFGHIGSNLFHCKMLKVHIQLPRPQDTHYNISVILSNSI